MKRVAAGFSLLEVMIAISILALALTALLGHQGIAIQMSDYSNRMSQAALLAQGKMLDVEHHLLKEGMEQYDDCEEGDFRDEGFRVFLWKACGIKLEMDEGAGEAITERFMTMFAGFGLGGGAAAGGPQGGMNEQALGQIGMAAAAIPTFIQGLEDKVRKVRLEVTWTDQGGERVLLFERFVTTLGSDPTDAPPPKEGEAEPSLADIDPEQVQEIIKDLMPPGKSKGTD